MLFKGNNKTAEQKDNARQEHEAYQEADLIVVRPTDGA